MSMDSSTMNPNWAPPPPRPGMSGGAKLLIGIGVGCGIMMLVCCGGLAGVGFYLQSWAKQAISEDPAVVREVASGMARIDVPEGLQPAVAFRLKKLPWVQDVGKVLPSFVVYADRATGSELVLASTVGGTSAQQQHQVRSQIDAMLQQKGFGNHEELQPEKTYSKELEIGGQKASFAISKGKSSTSGKTRIHATGTFQGNNGPVVLFLFVDAEKYSEETVAKTLDSIRVDSQEVKLDEKKLDEKKLDEKKQDEKKPDEKKLG